MLKGLTSIVIGSSHIKKGLECQDNVDLHVDENNKYAICLVADGHGSKSYFRSAKGSEFATRAAKESIIEYIDNYEKFVNAYQKNKEYLVDAIVKMIIVKWNNYIQQDVDENPITPEEIDKYLDGKQDYKLASIYGTTILAGVMSEDFNFGFLIGDGSFVVINKFGEASMPIDDIYSVGNRTSSMCDSDCYNKVQKYFADEKLFSIMVSTDGLSKSFGDEASFLDYSQGIAMEIGTLETQEDLANMEDKLNKIFEKRSELGSEDDISISIIFDSNGFKTVLAGLKTRRSINKLEKDLKASEKRIDSIDFIKKQIKERKKNNQEELDKLKKEKSELEKMRIECMAKIKSLEKQIQYIEKQQIDVENEAKNNAKKISDREDRHRDLLEEEHKIDSEKKEEEKKINDIKEQLEQIKSEEQSANS